jgi:hypothetical protein
VNSEASIFSQCRALSFFLGLATPIPIVEVAAY